MRNNVYDNRFAQKQREESSIPVACKCGWSGTQADLTTVPGTVSQKNCPTCAERFQADEP